MFKDIIVCIRSYNASFKKIKQYQLLPWVIFLGLCYVLFFIISLYFIITYLNLILTWICTISGLRLILANIDQDSFLSYFSVFHGISLYIILFITLLSILKFAWLLFMSPFLYLFSSKVKDKVFQLDTKKSIYQFLLYFINTLFFCVKNFCWQILFFLIFFFFSFIPIIGWFMPLGAFTIEVFYNGYTIIETQSLYLFFASFQKDNHFINQNKGLSIGIGAGDFFLKAIPIVGWFFTPSIPIIATTLSLKHTNMFRHYLNK
ncbi:MAG: EI24 domain-containing protein [Phycisphaerales bacterium]|nr:EI24 domain-containing protein [Phycisphaerales bacterium]